MKSHLARCHCGQLEIACHGAPKRISMCLHHAEAAETIEWRGPQTPAGLAPFAAIARLSVSKSHSVSAPRRDVLVVYRLDGPGACIVAVLDVASGNANQEARTIADARARHFRCGIDRPSGPA